MTKTNSLTYENFWVGVIWLFVFMVVIAWDQEKIVVLNLIIFSYAIYFGIGDNIISSFEQRQVTILSSLTVNIVSTLESLKTSLTSLMLTSVHLGIFSLTLVKQFYDMVVKQLIIINKTSTAINLLTVGSAGGIISTFMAYNQYLSGLESGVTKQDSSSNLVVANLLETTIIPSSFAGVGDDI